MENYHNHGSPSSLLIRDSRSVTSELSAICAAPPVHEIITSLAPHSPVYIVGGAIRDLFLGKSPDDFDIALPLAPNQVIERLNCSGIKTVDVSAKHGTVIAVIEDRNVEITSFQAHVKPGDELTIENDLRARDFTINAIAFDVTSKILVDPNNAVQDLSEQVLRAVGSPKSRFEEDPLRILRMVRFGPASDFNIDPDTAAHAKSLVSHLASISPERIRAELDNILLAKNVIAGLRTLLALGAFEVILPEILPSIGVEQNEFHYEDVFDHTVTVTSRTPIDRILRWSALFHDLGKPATLSIGEDGRRHFYGHEKVSEEIAKIVTDRLRFSHSDRDAICNIVREHMRPVDCGLPGVRRILRDLGPNYDRWRTFKVADAPPTMPENEWLSKLERFDELVKSEKERLAGAPYGKLAVNGDDLKQEGFIAGPKMGQILKYLEEVVIEDPSMNDKDRLLTLAKERFSTK